MITTQQTRLRIVTSRQNQIIKTLREAFEHSGITPDGLCAIEGARMVEDAIRAGWKLSVVAFDESARNVAERLLTKIGVDTECIIVPDDVFQSAVATETPQGVAALIQRKPVTVDDVLHKETTLCVVAVGIQDPGNLGTMIRSAEAFHASGVLLTENTVSAWNSKAVRASAGSILRLPCVQVKTDDIKKKIQSLKIRAVGTSSHDGNPLQLCNLKGPLALYIGNEGAGLPREIITTLDELATIPHAAGVESLNAGVAASIVFYEIARQRADHAQLKKPVKSKRKSK